MKRVARAVSAFSIALASGIGFPAAAQSLSDEEGVEYHWEAGIMAGFNIDGYELELTGYYFPRQWFGLKVGIGMAGEYQPIEGWYWSDEDGLYFDDLYYDDSHYAARFKFNPALVFRTPRLINWASQGAGVYLFAEPGIILSPGASGSRDARVLCWDAKAGINLQLGRCVVTLGYGISDFSLYSGRPINENGLPDDDNYLTHTVFAAVSYKF